jgi:hypothetical protein
MADFTLEPDELGPERPVRSRPVRLVSSGVAPTADVPAAARTDTEPAPVHVPCGACGALVLTGAPVDGRRLALDPSGRTYVVRWHHEAQPVLSLSRAYPVHQCRAEGPRGRAPHECLLPRRPSHACPHRPL